MNPAGLLKTTQGKIFAGVVVLLVIALLLPSKKKGGSSAPAATQSQVQPQPPPPVSPSPPDSVPVAPPDSQNLPVPDQKDGSVSLQPPEAVKNETGTLKTESTESTVSGNIKKLAKGMGMREFPDKNKPVVAYLPAGSEVEVLEYSYPWVKVKHKGRVGYIYTCNVFCEGECKTENAKAEKKEVAKTERPDVRKENVVRKQEEKQEEAAAEKPANLSVVCSKKDCVLYDKGVAYRVGDRWRGHTIQNINIFSVEVVDDKGNARTISIE